MPNQNIHDLYIYSYKTAAKEKCSPGSDIEKNWNCQDIIRTTNDTRKIKQFVFVKPLTHDPSRRPVVTGRRDGRHDGRCLLAAVLTSVVTAPFVTRPVLTAVNGCQKYRPSQRPSRRPVSDGSCVRGFTKTNCLTFLVSFVARIMSWPVSYTHLTLPTILRV